MSKFVKKSSIGIVYAGGTFGSYGKPLASLEAGTFLPVLSHILQTHFASYPNHVDDPIDWQLLNNQIVKDSSQLTPADFAYFYQLILQAIGQGLRQFVVLTGTDTLSYLAAFLAECFAGSHISIVVTGAMKPLLDSNVLTDYVLDPHSDATQNLFDACKLARHGEPGVRVCFSGEDWPAQTVQKIHSHDLMAFVGHHRAGYPANSYSAKITPAQHQLWVEDRLQALPAVSDNLANANIATLYLTPLDTQLLAKRLENLLSERPDAIIIMAFGAGNMPFDPTIQQQLLLAKKQGCLVAVTTQCPYGGISQTYEAGAWLADTDVLATGRLTLPAIFARLLWLIGNYDSPARRRKRWTHCLKDTHTVA